MDRCKFEVSLVYKSSPGLSSLHRETLTWKKNKDEFPTEQFSLPLFFSHRVSSPVWPYLCEEDLDFLIIHMSLLGAEIIN